MNDLSLRVPDLQTGAIAPTHLPIGRHLVNEGIIAQRDLLHALDLQSHVDAPLGDIMISEGLITRENVLDALSLQWGTRRVDLDTDPPQRGLSDLLPSDLCLRHNAVAWRQTKDAVYVATSRPLTFDQLRKCLGLRGQKLVPVIAEDVQIQSHLSRIYGPELAEKAAIRVPAYESCRSWAATQRRRSLGSLAAFGLLGSLMLTAPLWTITALMIWATLTLFMTTALKAAAFWSQLSHRVPSRTSNLSLKAAPFRLPRVSVLVPLLKEKEIAGALIKRLSALTYPKSLLNVVLVLEQGDTVTRDTIADTELPEWMSVIEVPEAGSLTTKPRALNYALNFCRGSVIGVWDAEDWPEADQIERVVTRFNEAPENVACLQGILDYYNSRSNWISRCFTIEYATWWRIVLPGIARLGLVVPLGGTTLFFRRDILENLCGWDAHNVTEDADLGVRLARHGYVTELLPTVTHEEATSRAWPWVRQRSRWLKGFMITYCVHMRRPGKLLRELGLVRFLGVQTIFLATFSQFACAPLLWSFWLTLFGVTHPIELTLGAGTTLGMAGFFFASELLNISMGLVAVSGRAHRHLMLFVPTMMFYFTLGALASYKALWEMMHAPFYWDKTQHGVSHRIDKPPV